MKKTTSFPLLIILLLISFKVQSQNYTPLDYYFNGTPTHGIKIKTNFPFTNGIAMPTIMLEGFDYIGGNVIDIKLNWYIYNNIFYRANASSSGAYSPEIKLANDGGKVSIYINDKRYYSRFTVRVYSYGKSETTSMFNGWTAVDEPISGTDIKVVKYNSNFGNNVVINANGNVGIGAIAPLFKMHIKDPSGGAALGIERGGKLWRFDIQHTGDKLWLGNTDLPSLFEFSNSGFLKVKASSGNTTKAKILVEGIGETNSGSGTTGVSGSLASGSADAASFGRFNVGIESWFGIGFKSTFNQKAGIVFDTRNANAYFEGKIGIGTDVPDAKLTVKGNIHTNEVKVDLLGAVAPDYVFYKDYDLKTLTEVENYISKEGHLPNIPSAKEMETNGLFLKDMNLKLLEKIEELTLYTINQEKRIKSLEDKNEKLILLVEKLLKTKIED